MREQWLSQLRETFGEDLDVRTLPARQPQSASFPDWLSEQVSEALAGVGITALWPHQREALDRAHEHNNVVVATGTASGKSLTYQVPMLEAVTGTSRGRAIYIAPTKALARDQLRALEEFNISKLGISAFDGDSDSNERTFAREHAEIVVTNPDMLHHSLLPGHTRWSRFLRSLSIIAVDECHMYRGMFGAHTSHVLRRLIRLAEHYGATPQVIMASATVSEPAHHAEMLTGRKFVAIESDTSPRGSVTIALTLPRPALEKSWEGDVIRRSVVAETADALVDLVKDDVRTLAFVRSRKAAETVAQIAREHLHNVQPDLVSKVTSYRGGYLPEERRELERALRDGELLGVATTNALELGVDISGLDATVLAGWPGSRASFWQQVGRAGRSQQDALALLIAADNPLDQYLVNHPEAIYEQPVEASVCDPENRNVLYGHLACATAELHVTESDFDRFAESHLVSDTLDQLCADGLVRRRPAGWFWAAENPAHKMVDIRGAGLSAYQIVVSDTGQLVGTVDAGAAFRQVHEGAVYMHLGETFIVTHLDIENRIALVESGDFDYSTYARGITSIEIVSTESTQVCGQVEIHRGIVDVTEKVVGFQKRRNLTGQMLGEEPLELPAETLRTQSTWWTIPGSVLAAHNINDIAGCVHAAEHAAIGMLPLFTACDRNDIGGLSMPEHPDTGVPTVFIYDGYSGGAGYSWHGFEQTQQWLGATATAIRECECQTGCPSCVQSPKCGSNNTPLDKAAAVALLEIISR